MTDISEIQIGLDKALEYIKNSQFDDAIDELKDNITKSDCSVCQYELSILVADTNHNRDICMLESDTCNMEKEAVMEKISELKKDLELAKEFM